MIPIAFPGALMSEISIPDATVDADLTDSGEAAAILSVVQAGTTYSENASGELVTFAPNVLRVTDLGTLVEGERTNHCPESTTPGITVGGSNTWTRLGTTITADDAEAPDRTMTAYLMTDTAVSNQHYIGRTNLLGSPSGIVTFSAWLKPNTINFAQMTLGNVMVIFDLVEGRWRNFSVGGSGIFYNAGVREYINGWLRCWSVVSLTNSTARIGMVFDDTLRPPGTTGGSISTGPTYLGDGTGSIWIWGPQIEMGTTPSSYIPTVGKVSVTRANDVHSFIGSADTALNVPYTTGGAAVVDLVLPDGSNGANIITGAGGAPVFLGQHEQDLRRARFNVSGDTTSGMSRNGASFTTGMKVGMSFDSTRKGCVAGKGVVTTQPSEPFSAGTRYLGDGTLFGFVRGIKLWNQRITNAALQFYTSFTEPVESTSTAPEVFYFGAVSDRLNFIRPGGPEWATTGATTCYWHNGSFNQPTDLVMERAHATNISDWEMGPGPRFYNVATDGDTVSIGTAVEAPDGTMTAYKLVESASVCEHYVRGGTILGTSAAVTGGIRFRFQCFGKIAERTRIVMIVTDTEWGGSQSRGGVNGFKVLFDLVGNQVVDSYTFGEWKGTLVTPEIVGWGDGWFRCRILYKLPLQPASCRYHMRFGIQLDAGWGTNPEQTYYQGDGSSGLYLWKSVAMLAGADDQITEQLLYDDFDDPSTIDLDDTRLPGYNIYMHRSWPTIIDAVHGTYTEDMQPAPENVIIEDSIYRQLPDANARKTHVMLSTGVWAGWTDDARVAPGPGLNWNTDTWDQQRENIVGRFFKPPFLVETRCRWTDISSPPPHISPSVWSVAVTPYLTPVRNIDGSPVTLLFPTTAYDTGALLEGQGKVEFDWIERGHGSVWHNVDSAGVCPGHANVPYTLYDTYYDWHTWTGLCIASTADDHAFHAMFQDGIFYSDGNLNFWDMEILGRDNMNDQWCVVWMWGWTFEIDWIKIYGDPDASISLGLANGPLPRT